MHKPGPLPQSLHCSYRVTVPYLHHVHSTSHYIISTLKPNTPPSPAVDYNGYTSALKYHPDFPNELEQGEWLKRGSVVWPFSVLELLYTEGSVRGL